MSFSSPLFIPDPAVPEDKKKGCLWGLLIGSALGAPLKGLKSAHIDQRAGTVSGYVDWARFWPDNPARWRRPGLHTADAQEALLFLEVLLTRQAGKMVDDNASAAPHPLTLALLEGFLQLAQETREPVRAFPGGFRQAGPSLRRSLTAIVEAPRPIAGEKIWSYHRPSAGAGAAARVALLGLWKSRGSDEVLLRLAIESALLTHGDPRAVAAAIAILFGVRQLAELPARNQPDPREFLQRLIEKLRAGEQFLLSEYSDALDPERNRAGDRDISESLGVVASLAREKKDDLAYRTLITQVRNYSPDQPIARPNHAFSPLAIPMAFYHALRAESFQSGLETIINQGGDCDTLGTLVGALLGARFGESGIPAGWIEELVARRLLEQRAEALVCGHCGGAWDDLLESERRWTAEEEAGRAALFLACRKELEREERRKRARQSRRTSPTSKAPAVPQGLPFAPPPELWLRDKAPDPAGPKQPLQRPAGGAKKRIPWKEERRRERRKRGDGED